VYAKDIKKEKLCSIEKRNILYLQSGC